MDLFRTWFWEMDWIWFSYLLTILFNVWVEWWTWFGDRDLLWLLYWCMDVLTLWRLVKRLQMQLLFNWTGNVRVFSCIHLCSFWKCSTLDSFDNDLQPNNIANYPLRDLVFVWLSNQSEWSFCLTCLCFNLSKSEWSLWIAFWGGKTLERSYF